MQCLTESFQHSQLLWKPPRTFWRGLKSQQELFPYFATSFLAWFFTVFSLPLFMPFAIVWRRTLWSWMYLFQIFVTVQFLEWKFDYSCHITSLKEFFSWIQNLLISTWRLWPKIFYNKYSSPSTQRIEADISATGLAISPVVPHSVCCKNHGSKDSSSSNPEDPI